MTIVVSFTGVFDGEPHSRFARLQPVNLFWLRRGKRLCQEL